MEIKPDFVPKLGKHHSQTCDDMGAMYQFVVYGEDDELPIGNNIRMIALSKITEKLIVAQS